MHLGLAGLLHFVRNDGKGVVNYGSINSFAGPVIWPGDLSGNAA
ncbi:MAG: hypothetical protein AWT59_1302 [Candidatus Gallionella acididurans]|uniref:Uncharacterized protein n=1 Tax=Candidatus Gallionella acididurans TaxID=1796491 RepID=A0A139BUE7_9PROT|nr:MAG: hypothetical protein AWT59_1302 [Candidatus Gallionella acididurans]